MYINLVSDQNGNENFYLYKSYRDRDSSVKKIKIVTLGNLKDLTESSGWDSKILKDMMKKQIDSVKKDFVQGTYRGGSKTWGPSLIFEKLWRASPVPDILSQLYRNKKNNHYLEEATFGMVLCHLFAGKLSENKTAEWINENKGFGFDKIRRRQVSKTLEFLGENRFEIEKIFYGAEDSFSLKSNLKLAVIEIGRTAPCFEKIKFSEFTRESRFLLFAINDNGVVSGWNVITTNTLKYFFNIYDKGKNSKLRKIVWPLHLKKQDYILISSDETIKENYYRAYLDYQDPIHFQNSFSEVNNSPLPEMPAPIKSEVINFDVLENQYQFLSEIIKYNPSIFAYKDIFNDKLSLKEQGYQIIVLFALQLQFDLYSTLKQNEIDFPWDSLSASLISLKAVPVTLINKEVTIPIYINNKISQLIDLLNIKF